MGAAWHAFFSCLRVGFPFLGAPRRVFAPAGRLTFFAGAKKVSKETPNTSLFERSWFKHLTPLRRVVRSVATSIHGDVKDLFFKHEWRSTTVIPDFARMTKRRGPMWRTVLTRRNEVKTSPERQWPLVEPGLHVGAPAPSHPSPNRLVFRCFLGDFFCTSKRSYSAAGPNTRCGVRKNDPQKKSKQKRPEDERSTPC